MTKNQMVWLAGFIDGEGHLAYYKRVKNNLKGTRIGISYTKLLVISNTSPETMIFISNLLKTPLFQQGPRTSNSKMIWKIRLYGENVEKLLIKLLPYLRVKKDQAKLLLSIPKGRRNTLQIISIKEEIHQKLIKTHH